MNGGALESARAVTGLPRIDAAKELSGRGLIDALRNGGYVLYIRHGETGVVTTDCKESNLTVAGEAQARAIGAGLRNLRVPVGEVWASEYCRARDTARLLEVGEVRSALALNQAVAKADFNLAEERYKRLGTLPRAGTNTVLVSHLFTIGPQDRWIVPDIAETVVFLPDGKGGAVPVARVSFAKWGELAAMTPGR